MNTTTKTTPAVEIETIVDGNFATTKKGNFSAYSENRNRYFVSRKAMEAIGITTDEEFASKSPLFAIVTTKTWNELVSEEDVVNGLKDAQGVAYTQADVTAQKVKTIMVDGNVKNVTFDRQEASAIFDNEDDAIKAFTAKRKLMRKIEKQEQLDAIKDKQEIELATMQSKLTLQKFADDNKLTPEKLQALFALSS